MATTKNTYTQSGSTTDYSFTFPYIKQTDVKVSLDNVVKTLTTDYTFANATTVSLNSAPAAGTTIDIYRSTDDSNLVATFYPGSAIRSADLNDNYTQNLYSTQENTNDATEALDNSRVLEDGAYVSAITKSSEAVTTANTASTNATNAVNTANAADTIADNAQLATDRLVGTTSDGGSTWTVTGNNTNASTDPKGLGYAITTADSAVTTANTATTTANSAVTTANSAVSTANSAVSTANTANTTADAAETKADSAVSTANTADTVADSAKLATDRLVATTSDGGSTWTLAGNNTNASTDPKGVGYAITQAEAAVTTANAASAAVSNAILYALKDDKTDFEAVTFDGTTDHEAWEITDSTGITSSYTSFTDNGGSGTAKTVTGVPADFTGDSGLSARFTYAHGSNTFTWAGYWVNDAEARYVDKTDTAANLPSGTTAQRPGTPAAGMFRYNTTESEFEGYDGSEWGKVGGGLVTIDGGNFTLGTSLVNETESYDGGSFN